jgi:hypothetical protein
LGDVIKEIQKQAEERMLAGKADPTENSPGGKGESRDEIAKLAQASSNTMMRVKWIYPVPF